MDLNVIATPTARKIFLSEPQDAVRQSEEEFSFFSSIKLKSGVTKTTDRNRLRNIDNWLCSFLIKGKLQKVLDVGISSGITTVELCESFEANNIPYQITAMDSDLTAFLFIFSDKKSILTDKFGNPIHFEMSGKGFGYVKGTNVRHRFERALLKLQTRFFIKFHIKDDLENIEKFTEKNGVKINRLELVCREIRENSAVKLSEDSIFSESSDDKYNIIRAANILNKGYFNDEQLIDALRKLRNRLEKNGYLLICRTNMKGNNNATLFTLTEENKFMPVDRFGEGSEIDHLVYEV